MGEKEWSPASIFDVFGDSLSRYIIVLANNEPLSAEELADRLDVSLPTIYRRTNKLIEHDLLTKELQIDEGGNQYKVFKTKLKRISFEINDDGYSVDMQMKHDLAGQFEGFWTDLGRANDRTLADTRDSRQSDAYGDPS